MNRTTLFSAVLALFTFAVMSATATVANAEPEVIVLGQEHVHSATPVVACNPACISYRYHHLGSRCKFDRCNMHPAVLLVNDPCKCCAVQVPVCVPACCTTPCTVDCRRGLFGRTIHEYCWDCGFRMSIVVLKNGDMIVHYYGIV